MKLPQLNKVKWNYLALAFAFPAVGMLFVMIISQYAPFGRFSMLYSDSYHQYFPFFLEFRRALLRGDSLLYSWNVGMGMDYVGLISYYLASPLYLLGVLIPESLLLYYYSFLIPIKLGFAGLFFAVFLKKIFRKDDLSISLFGCFYALCAWALGYQWNIMWLDTFALLPLVALGTVSLLRDKKFILYTITLFLSIYSNYYIGLFTCIFVLLLFFCYEICRGQGIGRFFADLCRIALFSLLAIGLTAFLELPTLAALQTTQSSVNNFPEGFRLNIADENTWQGLLDAMRQVAGNMGGGLEHSWKEGLPNLYCGVGTVMLAFLYLMAKDVKLRDKLCCVFLLIFFILSFIIRQLDYIWHGFHFTNMIPYRFSFLYSFVLLYMAYRAWLMRRKFKPWQLIAAALLAAAVFACSDQCMEPVFLAYNAGFLVVYLALMLYGQYKKPAPAEAGEAQHRALRAARSRRRSNARLVLFGVMAVELILNLVNFGLCFGGSSISNYPKGTKYTASIIRYMKEREEDNLFFRAEMTHAQTLNDGALNNYNGVSTFTSSANVKVTQFMKILGYGAKNTYNRYCYEESSPVADLFLGVKYMIERDGKDKQSAYWNDIYSYDAVHLLENTAYLPLGFLTEPELAELSFDFGGGTFAMQNRLFRTATGVEGDVWRKISYNEIVGNDVNITSESASGYITYQDCKDGANVVYSYLVDQEGFMCVDLNLPKRNDVTISRNGVELYRETMSLQQMLAVGDVQVGDVIEIRMTCDKDEKGTMTVSAAILNNARFREGYEILNDSLLELTTFKNTFVEGTITCNRDGLLYTSIPQNGNWSVEVDGELAEISLVGEAMIGVLLPEGTHTVSFIYHNAAFSLGWKISAGCAAVFALLILLVYQPKIRHGKYEKHK